MTMTKIADTMRGVNSRIAELKAATSELTVAEKRALLESLTAEVQAASAGVDGPKRRLANIKAAAAATDPYKKKAFASAVSGLRRLGIKLEQIAAKRERCRFGAGYDRTQVERHSAHRAEGQFGQNRRNR
jgi:hypothetical protein